MNLAMLGCMMKSNVRRYYIWNEANYHNLTFEGQYIDGTSKWKNLATLDYIKSNYIRWYRGRYDKEYPPDVTAFLVTNSLIDFSQYNSCTLKINAKGRGGPVKMFNSEAFPTIDSTSFLRPQSDEETEYELVNYGLNTLTFDISSWTHSGYPCLEMFDRSSAIDSSDAYFDWWITGWILNKNPAS